MDWKRGREQIWRGNREKERLIRREKEWKEDREGRREGEKEGLGQGGMRGKKTNCDCGIRERKRNKRGRRREGGMTFKGRRTEE